MEKRLPKNAQFIFGKYLVIRYLFPTALALMLLIMM